MSSLVLGAGVLSGCGREGSVPGSVGALTAATPGLEYPVRKDAPAIGSKGYSRALTKDTITIGVKSDHPFMGFEDPVTGQRSGFDVEIAKMIAAYLGFGPSDIEWKTVAPQVREISIAKGDVDLFVGAYTINDERKKQVSFAGPYYVGGQDLLVDKENRGIRGPRDLHGKKVCTVTGSTPFQRISRPEFGATVVSHDSYAHCVQDLVMNVVDAVTADDTILKGYAAQNEGRLRVLGRPFSAEPYGVGLARRDAVLRDAVNDALEHHVRNGNWLRAYHATLGRSGAPAPAPPAVRRY
ncbi:glutamate ABC transporter substrate-binding protein [Streptomyces sp. JCM 35825]|nr:glutamate ABC transporter substrate-binding protein [Streptomyces sp. JCM 35825]WCL90085.1 glutamate ABC transporter substrate-binding protein [Streptomyces sp. JCM 35825]